MLHTLASSNNCASRWCATCPSLFLALKCNCSCWGPCKKNGPHRLSAEHQSPMQGSLQRQFCNDATWRPVGKNIKRNKDEKATNKTVLPFLGVQEKTTPKSQTRDGQWSLIRTHWGHLLHTWAENKLEVPGKSTGTHFNKKSPHHHHHHHHQPWKNLKNSTCTLKNYTFKT